MLDSLFRSPLSAVVAVLMVLVPNAPPVRAQEQSTAPLSDDSVSPRFRVVVDAVNQAIQQSQTPGVSIGILAHGHEEVASFGVTSVETNEPVRPDTRFQIGSITKTFTATALMRLVERGEVNLDAPVRTYLPEFRVADPEVSANVTVRNLLTHTGGWWGDSVTDTGDGPDAIARFVDENMPAFPQLAALGRYFTYNNSGLVVAGRIIEVVTGKTYREAMQELVLGPLGLDQSTLDPDAVLALSHSEGHAATAEGPRVQQPLFIPRNAEPAGGLHSTAHDMLQYARFQIGDGTTPSGVRLLRADTLRQMHSPQAPPPPTGDQMGFTWFVHTHGVPAIQHSGGTYGQVSILEILPEQGLALVVLANMQPTASNAHSGGDVTGAALRAFVEAYLPGGVAAYVAQRTVGENPAPPDLSEYAGEYGVPDLHVRIAQEDGGLVLYATPIDLPDQVQLAVKAPTNTPMLPERSPLTLTAPDTAVVVDLATGAPTQLNFVRTADGHVGWFAIGGALLFPRDNHAVPSARPRDYTPDENRQGPPDGRD
jgi:CubicO group peptidase (beta-lactamase class C family)